MAASVDRSRYRNPDIPVGYGKPMPKLVHKDGEVMIEGLHYLVAHILHEVNVENRPDRHLFEDLSFLSDSDDGIVKDRIPFIQDHEKNNVSSLEDFYSKMEIDPEKVAKKKIKRIEKERSDSNSPSRNRKHYSPSHNRKHRSRSRSHSPSREKLVTYSRSPSPEDVEVQLEPLEHGLPQHVYGSYPCDNVENRPDRKLFEDFFLSDSDDDHEKNNVSSLEDFYSKMEIDPEKGAKKKTKRIEKDRSDSNSPSCNRKHYSPSRHRTSSKEKSGHRSDSNSPSHNRKHRSRSRSHSPAREKLVTYSRSPSPEDVNVKQGPLEPGLPQHVYGSYHCDVCNISMTSLKTLNTHQVGKRHAKVLKLKTMEALGKNIPVNTSSENQPKFPNASADCIRRKVLTQAFIQEYVDQNITKPCPGLSFVIEIRKLETFNYYCKLCDSPCSTNSLLPHLNGYKHQLHCLKHFKPGAYEALHIYPKYEIEAKIRNILYAVEKREGRGRISVEIEELVSSTDISQSQASHSSASTHQQKTYHHSQPSTSRVTDSNRSASSFHEMYQKASVPDSNSSDFNCQICQSRMNSLQIWESHIRGKRHLANLKKLPGDKPSKTKSILVPNKKAYLMDRIKREIPNEPVVGLGEIRETELIENKSHSYQCFLCGSCHSSIDILEHLISLKHRHKYLEHKRFPGIEVTKGMKEAVAYGLVRDMCAEVEAEEGSGHPAVHVNKNFLGR